MAKHTALARPNVIVVNSGPKRRGGFSRRRARAVGRVARRGARRIGKAALPVTAIALGGVVVGYAQSQGLLDKLPAIGGSKMLTLGLAGFAATRFIRNQHVRMAGLAALAAAAVDFGRVQGGGTSGFEDDDGTSGTW